MFMNRLIIALLILCIMNNVESGPVLGAIAVIGCKAALASCVLGTSGVGLPLCYTVYASCWTVAMSSVFTPTP